MSSSARKANLTMRSCVDWPSNGLESFSVAGKRGLELSTYVSAQGGANTLVKALARELGPFNVQINAVGPNFLESPLYYLRDKWENDLTCRSYLDSHVPLQRLGNPEELGELVAFLASGKCNSLTGEVIYFTGGSPGMPDWPGRHA